MGVVSSVIGPASRLAPIMAPTKPTHNKMVTYVSISAFSTVAVVAKLACGKVSLRAQQKRGHKCVHARGVSVVDGDVGV